MKDEVDDDEEDEYEDVKDAFDEIPEDEKEGEVEEDTYDDHKSPANSDEESFSENDASSDDSDSDYEKPKKKKKRKSNLNNLRQFRGRTEEEIEEMKKGRGRFFCSVCEMHFKQESKMHNHVMKKHGPAPAPQCEICFLTFETRPKWYFHRRTVHSEKVPCEDCGKSFPKSILNNHMKQVHDVCDPRTCEHCGSVFTNERKFAAHMKSHTNPEVRKRGNKMEGWMKKIKENCRCNMEFKTKKSHVEHYKIFHENYQECPKCTKMVRRLDDRIHRCVNPKLTPRKGGTCPECGKYYERSESLWYHINATHSKTPASCEICGKVFKSRIHVETHMNKTHAERSACVVCGKEVANMKEHMGSMHTADYEKPYKCDHCGKGFTDNTKLRLHTNIHLNLKPYTCR